MSKTFKWNMFFTSFLPLWISIIVFDIWNIACFVLKYRAIDPKWYENTVFILRNVAIESITICILLICCIVSVHSINKEIREHENNPEPAKGKIVRARRANKLTAEFLLAYILPMIAFDYGKPKQIVLFLIYFAVLSFLCIRNNNVYTNILLEFKGYKMYDCDIECVCLGQPCNYTDCLVISKNNLMQSLPHEINFFDFENYIYIEIGGLSNE